MLGVPQKFCNTVILLSKVELLKVCNMVIKTTSLTVTVTYDVQTFAVDLVLHNSNNALRCTCTCGWCSTVYTPVSYHAPESAKLNMWRFEVSCKSVLPMCSIPNAYCHSSFRGILRCYGSAQSTYKCKTTSLTREPVVNQRDMRGLASPPPPPPRSIHVNRPSFPGTVPGYGALSR